MYLPWYKWPALVPSVVIAGIGDVEFAHEFGKVAELCFDQKVKMVAHEDIAVKFHRVNIEGLGEDLEEPLSVCVVSEDGLPFVSATSSFPAPICGPGCSRS